MAACRYHRQKGSKDGLHEACHARKGLQTAVSSGTWGASVLNVGRSSENRSDDLG